MPQDWGKMLRALGDSLIGRTSGLGPGGRGSNPCPPAECVPPRRFNQEGRWFRIAERFAVFRIVLQEWGDPMVAPVRFIRTE